MWHFMDHKFPGLRDTFHLGKQGKALRRSRAADILNAVESVVDGTDNKIRLVPGYMKKLQGTIQDSLDFADDLVSQIPLAIEVSSSTFTSDPYVNAFFTNVTDLQSIFSHSSEVQDYMEDCHDNNARCCALLCMHREEKTVMGMELSGNMLKKDVMQTAVSFSDHRVYSPAPSEPETREGLKNCLFQGLVTNALERIVQLRLANHQLQNRHQVLHARLRRHRQQTGKVGQGTRTIEKTNLELKKIEKEMLHAPLLTPQILLQQVLEVFSKPDDFVQVRKLQLRLNKMGIKISDNSAQADNKLNLTEVIIGNNLPRVVTLAMFPRKELLAKTVFSGF
ncbi:MAG TPA: hypothetical protein ENG92_05315 [Thiolapillus brandeum]|uniref:Uncharacterized protein n=1 Tax=Thiolapillus brandeum TaxID=1076588 RepID=A0A831K452_9GAMM|nr:hypothetical protein [Thiolapillus brandeum]